MSFFETPWLTYFILTMLVSAPFFFNIQRAGGHSDRQFDRRVRQMLWIPGIVALGIRIYSGLGFADLDLGPGRSIWLLLLALLLPLALEVLLVLTSLQFGLSRLDASLITFRPGGVKISEDVRLVFGSGKQSWPKFLGNVLATVSIGVLFMLIFSFAEEFGWRGYLQNQLLTIFGLAPGLVLGGVLWGAWYAPLVWSGFRFPEYPRLGALIFMPIYLISLGIISAWLYWFSGSLWTAAILNASAGVSSTVSTIALGEASRSRRIRVVWLWLWAVVAGLFLALWQAGYGL